MAAGEFARLKRMGMAPGGRFVIVIVMGMRMGMAVMIVTMLAVIVAVAVGMIVMAMIRLRGAGAGRTMLLENPGNTAASEALALLIRPR